MTKEELEKEAITRVDAFIDNFSQDIRSTLHDRLNREDVKDFLYGLYIDSAESREKQIAELEYQLTHRNCVDCSNHSSKLKMKVLELEKENAELKTRVSEQSERISELTQELDDKINRFG